MEKEFVPYELAVKLKQLGFDEPCLGRWLVITEWEKPTGEVRLQIGSKVENYSKNQCAAPLYQQAFRWFREKYGLHRHICYFEDTYFWHGDLYRLKDSGLMNCPMELTGYKTYEEAELACLSKLIEIMSNRLN